MTVNEALQSLTAIRDRFGGEGPLLTTEGRPVVNFGISDNIDTSDELRGWWKNGSGKCYELRVCVCEQEPETLGLRSVTNAVSK
jgi:hypothetical protein